MPSSLSHAMVAVALGSAIAPRRLLRQFLIAGVVCAVLPDVDAIGRTVGGGDIESLGGHRGLTHSLIGAVTAGVAAVVLTFPSRAFGGYRLRLALFTTLATAAHGALDAFTTIGATTSPVQFFRPFSSEGYTAPWKPIEGPFSELFYCLLPLLGLTRWIWRARGIPWPRLPTARPVVLDLSQQTSRNVVPPEVDIRNSEPRNGRIRPIDC